MDSITDEQLDTYEKLLPPPQKKDDARGPEQKEAKRAMKKKCDEWVTVLAKEVGVHPKKLQATLNKKLKQRQKPRADPASSKTSSPPEPAVTAAGGDAKPPKAAKFIAASLYSRAGGERSRDIRARLPAAPQTAVDEALQYSSFREPYHRFGAMDILNDAMSRRVAGESLTAELVKEVATKRIAEEDAKLESVRYNEFQAVLLAGGSAEDTIGSMFECPDGVPKALVEVGGRPLITYQLDTLESSGFREVIVVTTKDAAPHIEALLKARPLCTTRYVLHTLFMPGSEGTAAAQGDLGSADALRQVADKIKTDAFVVLSGDIVTNFTLRQLCAAHRVHSGAMTALLMHHSKTVEQRRKEQGDYEQTEWIGLDDQTQSLLLMTPRQGAETTVDVRTSVFTKFPSFTIRTDLSDCHAYVFSRWVLNVVTDRTDLRSVKDNVVPHESITPAVNEWSRNIMDGVLKADSESEAGKLFTALQASLAGGINEDSSQSLDATAIGEKMIAIVKSFAHGVPIAVPTDMDVEAAATAPEPAAAAEEEIEKQESEGNAEAL